MKITGTFLDEISHDIPHQNWGREEWDKDFASMKAIGIDTVILIRCGHKKFITYPSKYLMKHENCFNPPIDLVDMYLELAEKYDMKFYFGLYDSGKYWHNKEMVKEMDIGRCVAEEVQEKYGDRKAFHGWYINYEVSRAYYQIADLYAGVGHFVKDISGNKPTMISPYICGIKAQADYYCGYSEEAKTNAIALADHEREWNAILGAIQGAVDIVAFQDGHCDFDELADYLAVNKKLAERYGMTSWTNCESFDRDMPIRFLPIKWEKMLLKLEAAKLAGIDKAITFEYSHFMSPNSMYPSAAGLYKRYCEYFGL